MCKYWLKRAKVKDFWKTSQPILITFQVELIDNFMPFVEMIWHTHCTDLMQKT